ncbi:hypothetical protein B0A48_08760 [Cryoendolithus antarcticus]|uniref:Uncharacterized protein n=1 Tax=Cryoendolithus antarcticus TaxID=1507870 RepID=A0A1V8T4T4_9PEZI|nr:hypothetical protein B0A48_08760 [Cryoendolithus antarcticus]
MTRNTDILFAAGGSAPATFCVLELNSSAQEIGNYEFWIQLHMCSRVFHMAILQFADPGSAKQADRLPTNLYPLAEFVKEYNSRVDRIELPAGIVDFRPLFRVRLSDSIKRLAAGEDPRFKKKKERWSPFFKVAKGRSQEYCHVQVNFQVDLGWLGTNVDTFARLWWHTWVHRFRKELPPLETDVLVFVHEFSFRFVSVDEVYRTMQFAALWRVARKRAAQLVTEHGVGRLIEPARSQIIGLLTYLLAAGSLLPSRAMGLTVKNIFPLLPKTSPAALARAIVAQDASGAALETLANLCTDDVAATAEQLVQVEMRSLFNLVRDGDLRVTTPQFAYPGLPTFNHGVGRRNIFDGDPPPNFAAMWQAALEPINPDYNRAHNFGFYEGAPFHVAWSSDVRTAVPPTSGTSPPRLTFESRYATCILNIGWNPGSLSYMLEKSYLPLISEFAPVQLPAASTAVQALGSRPDIDWNFEAGWH